MDTCHALHGGVLDVQRLESWFGQLLTAFLRDSLLQLLNVFEILLFFDVFSAHLVIFQSLMKFLVFGLGLVLFKCLDLCLLFQ